MAIKHIITAKLRVRKKSTRAEHVHKAILALGMCIIMLAAIFNSLQNSHQLPVSASNLTGQLSTTTHTISVPKSHNPTNSTILNITFNITNDMAESTYGYWALGNYTENVRASPGAGGYNAIVMAYGTWRSIKGARSPVTGVKEPINASGKFTEIYTAIIPGRLNDTLMLRGYVGTFNNGGTFPSILENQSNQSRPASFNWLMLYFGTAPEYISILNSTTVFTYVNQTYLIVCTGSSDNCKSYWNGAGYFGGSTPASTVNTSNMVSTRENMT